MKFGRNHNQTAMSDVVVLDNGGGLIKAGHGGDRDPTTVTPNCLIRSPSSKKWVHPSDPSVSDLTSASTRRPIDRGHLINPELQREIWHHLFTETLKITPSLSSLLLTEPLLAIPSIQQSTDELVFEDFAFTSLFVADAPSLVHLYESSRRPADLVARSRCGMVVDCGFSFTHAAPVLEGFTIGHAVRRIDLGGKALTNLLKEMVSYRAVNVMDETFVVDDVKERLCFVSLDVQRDLQVARKPGRENLFRCTYVLPDGITHTKGFVKDPNEAQRHLALTDGVSGQALEEKKFVDQLEVTQRPGDRSKIDLTKNEFDLTNERFLVPEMIFQPADLGMNQAGLAECIVRSVNSCHPLLHPVLYESIILTGGSIQFPRFAERLERELRPLVPDDYKVKITPQEDPILGVWRGGSLLASSPGFEAMCVTKAEYEEHGSARCRRRFFR